ncbi:MAG TPA: prephenate dehydratase, partial [Polyangiales bacterium]|nr:prephenate dehydratase [Polyangiales bacterium]
MTTSTTVPPSQRPTPDTLIIAYQGTDGSYSQIAAESHFEKKKIWCRGHDTFRQILEAVENGAADYAMQPIENTTAGSINEAYDLLARMNLFVVGEEVLRVEHCLLALPNVQLDQIRRVYSHPQALAQCSDFLASLPGCEAIAFTDTAMSVRRVRDEKNPAQAAVASELAGKIYGLRVLKRDIANQRDNFTRFVVVSKTPASYAEDIACKTSLIFTTRHEQGALVRCLNILAERGLNLTKLESRPRPQTPFEYIFY